MKHTIRGRDYLQNFPNFRLKGRQHEIERISSILLRKSSNSLLLVGPAGVGSSALILGLQASKGEPDAPFDIEAKRFFWLDTDSLFASGDGSQINADFQTILRQLAQTPESVLIIENTFGFIEASRNSGNPHFINALTLLTRSDKTQVILEVRDEQLEQVLKWHSMIAEDYTLYDVREPVGTVLKEIVTEVAKGLADYHMVSISDEAIDEAITLTSKYRDSLGLGGAQPSRSVHLLDRALSSFRQENHRKHPVITQIEDELAAASDEAERAKISEKLAIYIRDWSALKDQIALVSKAARDGEVVLHDLQDKLEEARKEQEKRRAAGHVEEVKPSTFAELAGAGFDSPEVAKLKSDIKALEADIASNHARRRELVKKINYGLSLGAKDVINEFSKISGIAADKLDANEIENMRNLEANLLGRIFGQDEAVRAVANGIKVAKVDTVDESGPAASFLLLGPSGVGKTEIAKAVAQYVLGSEKQLIRFDMSEYMEKHAVAKLIGAPPGYEGFQAGGILTNKVRQNPVGVYLFDEIEKAHPDVFNVFLQILSDGRLTDNVGRTVDFSSTIIIMTSNIGQTHYLNTDLSDEEARQLATAELNQTYRSEFLNRFNGRENILHFKRLGKDVIARIIKREFDKLNRSYEPRGLRINITDESIREFCEAHYDPTRGARGLPGYIKANLRPVVVNFILENPGKTGVFDVTFDTKSANFVIDFKG